MTCSDWTGYPLPSAGKAEAARALVGLGCHALLIHGTSAGACTCPKGADCPSTGKHPIERGWQSAGLDATGLLAQLEARPELNIGWRMGVQPSGDRIIAVDDDGELEALETELGKLPPTLQQRTGSGGAHRYYRVPASVRISNRVKVGGRAVDVRCDGGQVVFAPSETPAGRYSLTHRLPIAELPPKWLVAITAAEETAAPADLSTWTLGGLRNQDDRVLAYCRRKAEEDRSIEGSNGSAALARWAGTVFWKLGLGEAEGLPLLREMNQIGASPPWSEAELSHAMRSGMKPHASRPEPRGHLLAEWAQKDERNMTTRTKVRSRGVTLATAAEFDDFGPLDAYELDAGAPIATTQGSGAARPGPSSPGGSGQGGGRPRVQLKNHPDEGHRELADVIEDAARVLGEHAPDVYCRDGQLVDVGPVSVYLGRDGKRRRTGVAVGIRPLPTSEVQRQLSRAAVFGSWARNRKTGEWFEVETDPPISLANAVANMGRWNTVRPLEGVTTAPALRPDGTVLQEPGWDDATGYLYEPSESFPKVPGRPTQADARAALNALREVFAPPGDGYDGFPFAGAADSYVPLAALLTLLARPAIDGPTPAFLFDAATPGSGKTLLADAVCLIATGHEMPKGTFPEKPDELEKMLGGLALQGCAVAGFDNLDTRTPLRGAALDKVLTGRLVQMRVLGESKSPMLTWNAVVLVTGNNVSVQGDTIRRCIRCRQEPDCERPEERANFRIDDLKGFVREHRPRLVCAALTLLRAYFVAGQPAAGAKPFGSFREWQRIVADAILWAGGANVLDCRTDADEGDDPELDAAATLLEAMHSIGKPVTAGELIAAGYNWEIDFRGVPVPDSESHPAIKDALDALVTRRGKDGRPTPRAVGWALKRIRGRVFNNLKLLSRPGAKGGASVEWYVADPRSGVSGVSGVFLPPTRARARAGKEGLGE